MKQRFFTRAAFPIAMVVGGTVLLILLLQTLNRAGRPQGNDFTSYLLAADAFWHGRNPFLEVIPFPYIYPLTFCVLLYPFRFLPNDLAVVIWFLISVFSMAY